MRLEDDPIVKTLPSKRMREQLCMLVVKLNLKRLARLKAEAEKDK